VVFHLADPSAEYEQAIRGFGFVQSVQSMENKLVVSLDDPEDQNPALVRTLVEAGANIQFVGEIRRRLEDVYLQLIKE
jgi:ABC-2 type transport system ATP-binding protein